MTWLMRSSIKLMTGAAGASFKQRCKIVISANQKTVEMLRLGWSKCFLKNLVSHGKCHKEISIRSGDIEFLFMVGVYIPPPFCTQCIPPPFCWGVNLLPNFQKTWGSLTVSRFLEEGCSERGDQSFSGGCSFCIKNKLKSDIFNDKEGL